MADNESISPRECDIARENLQKNIDVNTKRLDAHSQSIKELTRISDQLTQLIKIQSKQLENQTKQLEAYGHRLDELEKDRSTVPKLSWYETSTGGFVVRAGMVILVAIVAAAIGLNYMDLVTAIK
ncbi:MAG: hypothetical protein NHB14_20665 [Desulfosporosinus sp.]|nr:hypothetical protein [Desulfosporosinus sp.]